MAAKVLKFETKAEREAKEQAPPLKGLTSEQAAELLTEMLGDLAALGEALGAELDAMGPYEEEEEEEDESR